jgi:hypothetical protein
MIFFHEGADLYEAQIKQYLDRSNPVPDMEIVLDIKHIFRDAGSGSRRFLHRIGR